jgi:F0F1-type ATP synthase membrane subunit b/b'
VDRTFFAIFVAVAIFVGFQIGYALPPFLQAGVFDARREKGVESKIDDALKKHFEELYRSDE